VELYSMFIVPGS